MMMQETYANQNVLEFYRKLPFNYYGSVKKAAQHIKENNAITNYPVLIPFLKKKTRVLDVGCGAGWFVNTLSYYYKTVTTGIDFNHVAIEQARQVASILKVESEFMVADLFKYRPAVLFDLVTSIGVLHHTDNCIEALRHICRHCVRNEGHLFIGLYHLYGRRPFLDHFDELKSKGLNEDQLFQEYKRLHPKSTDSTHHRSWFCDQVLHPHETQHTLEEIVPIIESEGMKLESTSINKFEPFASHNQLYEIEKNYYKIGKQKLYEGKYFPGFFVFLAKKDVS